MALFSALWTGAPPPPELVIYRLAEKFHALPHEVSNAPWRSIQQTLTIMDVENKVQKLKKNAGITR